MGVLCLYLFCYALLCVCSCFAIILKRKLIALLVLSYRCFVTIIVLWHMPSGINNGGKMVALCFHPTDITKATPISELFFVIVPL